jgi:hypothetical protein
VLQIFDFAVSMIALDYFSKFIRVGIKEALRNWKNSLVYRWRCVLSDGYSFGMVY